MRDKTNAVRFCVLTMAVTAYGGLASAQYLPPPTVETSPAPVSEPPPTELAPPMRTDGPRFRGAVAFTGGGEFVSNFHAYLIGVDGRLGVQINDLVGLYVAPHLSFGSGREGAASGSTGTVCATAMVDFTFLDRAFVGVGFGYGIVENPTGPVLHIRLGGYPIMGRSQIGPRRKGLVASLEMRTFLLGSGVNVVQMMAAIGYEAF